jgi:DNA-binding CsgD family transcriptional regulator
VEPCAPRATVAIRLAAYGLSRREAEVARLVLRGSSTRAISAALHISPHTVQDHLKAVFEKTGVSSRRELSSRIFFDQYVGRLGSDLDANGWFSEG